MAVVKIKWQVRHDTAANWTSANPTLLAGEIGFETDTGKFKIGNGTTTWSNLAYAAGFTEEDIEDIVGAMATNSDTITLTYDDDAGTLTAALATTIDCGGASET